MGFVFALVIGGIIGCVTAILGWCVENIKPKQNNMGSTFDDYSDIDMESIFQDKKPPKKHSGKCDGNCANCPPHYGYRYGRWYYGHGHSEGCVRGGNKCNGGKD